MTINRHILGAGLCALVLNLGAAAAAVEIEISGEIKLNGIQHLDKRPCAANPGKACTAYFELYGETARRMFDNMKAPARTDLCTEGLMKTDPTGLHCYRSGRGEYGCYFGYDFTRARIVEGAFSC